MKNTSILALAAASVVPQITLATAFKKNDVSTSYLGTGKVLTSVRYRMPSFRAPRYLDSSEFSYIHALEMKFRAGERVARETGFKTTRVSHGVFSHQLNTALVVSKNQQELYARWAKLKAIAEKALVSTKKVDDIQYALVDLHKTTQDSFKKDVLEVKDVVDQRIVGPYGHQWNDVYEQSQVNHPKRSLGSLYRCGIKSLISPEGAQRVKDLVQQSPDCPIFDRLKTEKVFTINGFKGSKTSLVIHDTFDHFFTYSLLKKNGVMDRYSGFLSSLGNPQDTDIFSREGEVIASTAYHYRSMEFADDQFPMFKYGEILALFAKKKTLNENEKSAYSILKNRQNDTQFSHKIVGIVSGILVELMEQRRKHGFIRTLDPSFQPVGLLQAWDPHHVAFMVEVATTLCDNADLARRALVNTTILVEDYLQRVAANPAYSNEALVLKNTDLEDLPHEKIKLKPHIVSWISNNPGVSSVKDVGCA